MQYFLILAYTEFSALHWRICSQLAYFIVIFQMATKAVCQEQIHYRGVLTRWVCDGVAELDHSLLLFLFHHTTSPILQVLTPNPIFYCNVFSL